MAVFIPEIWSQKVLADTIELLVGEQICNKNWEGDIKEKGDKVHIMSAGSVTAKNYTRDTDIASPEVPADTDTELDIDQAKYVNFGVDRLDIAQSNLNRISIYSLKAVLAIKKVVDTFVMGKYSDADSSNVVTNTYNVVTKDNVYDCFNEMFRRLTENQVQLVDRWAVINSKIMEIINEYLAAKSTSLGDEATKNGYLGKFAGFNMFLSHNVQKVTNSYDDWAASTAYAVGDKVKPTTPNSHWYECSVAGTSHSSEPTWGTTNGGETSEGGGTVKWICKDGDYSYKIMAGHNEGITLAFQIPTAETKLYYPEKRFGQAVKMLALYGAKVLDSGKRIGYIDAPLDV